jgi:hypothetical protein
MFISLLLLGILLFGLVLLAIGVILLLKTKNRFVGMLAIAIGLVFTILPLVIFLMLAISTTTMG